MKTKLTALVALTVLASCAAEENPKLVVGELASDRHELTAEVSEPILSIAISEGEVVVAGQILIEQVGRREATCMNLLDPREFALPKFEFLRGAFDVGPSGCNLFGARAAHKFVETRLMLRQGGCGFCKTCCRTGTVLLYQYLPGNDHLTLRNRNRLDGLADLGREFVAIGGQFADDKAGVFFGRAAGQHGQRNKYGKFCFHSVCSAHAFISASSNSTWDSMSWSVSSGLSVKTNRQIIDSIIGARNRCG